MSDDQTIATPPPYEPMIRVVAMPADTNPAGDIFGGWLVSQMDLAAGTLAAKHARGRCVTIAIDRLIFHLPVAVGDEISIYTKIVKTGRTSMVIHVQTWRRPRHDDQAFLVTEGTFTFVAIDENRRPRTLPEATPATTPA